LVGRLRPVVAHPVAHGGGASFPSGHSLGSFVCYGAVLLAFLPAVPGRWRRPVVIAVATLVALIGISRILLGVHFLSDVVGAWALGVAWLGATTYGFELARAAQPGRAATKPLAEGLEPEAAPDIQPTGGAEPVPPADRTPQGQAGERAARHPGSRAAG